MHPGRVENERAEQGSKKACVPSSVLEISNFCEFVNNDKFVDQNCKNHERDSFHFLIISTILVELLRHTIPHFKALY